MSTTSTTSATFNGVSSYASDLQSVIDRAVQIASMPLQLLENTESGLANQQTELQTIDSDFGDIQSALNSLNTAATATMQASVSDSTVVSANAAAGALAGTYSIEVLDIGSYSSAYSTAGTTVSDPSSQSISSSSSFTLQVDGTQYTITPSSQTLSSLASAINSAGAPVQATIVNIGSSSAPDYRLALQGTKLASDTFQLNDGSQDLLTSLADGSPASYKVNGLPTAISSDSRSVTLSPGLTVNLLQNSAAGVSDQITVSKDTSALETALNSFVSAYNKAATEVGYQYGQNAGPLQGQSIVSNLSASLRSLSSYTGTGTGTIRSLTDLGISVDQNGVMSFDSSTFESAEAADPSGVSDFLGSTGGSGFLQTAGNVLTSLLDPDSGMLQTQFSSLSDSIKREDSMISDKQDQITALQNSLTQQMAAADALISSLESQKTYMTDLFEAMKINSQNTQ